MQNNNTHDARLKQLVWHIRSIMNEKDLSIVEVARRLNTSPQNISNKLDGKHYMTIKFLYKLEDALDTKFILPYQY